MTDVRIPISGDIQPMYNKSVDENLSKGFELPHALQFPVDQLGFLKAHEWVQHRKANIRPWAVFLNSSNFRTPPSLPRLSRRVMRNIEYFQSNYLFVFIGLVIYSLITSPLLLLTVIAFLATCYKLSHRFAKQDVMLLNYKLTLVQIYSIVAVCSLPVFYLVGAGAALFWVLGVSWFLIMLHASSYNIDSILCPGEDELNSLVMQEV